MTTLVEILLFAMLVNILPNIHKRKAFPPGKKISLLQSQYNIA